MLLFVLLDKSEVDGVIASASERNLKPREAGRKHNSPRQAAKRRSLGCGEKKKIEPGATERQRRSVGRQIRARTVAKRSSEPWQARDILLSFNQTVA